MSVDLHTFAQLRSAAGQELLARAAALPDLRDETLLRHLTAFRRGAAPALAAAALEMALLRRRAAVKFTHAPSMYVTRDALEQASAEVIARHRARRYAGRDTVIDVGCGIGGDTLALAGVVPRVIAVERDPVRLVMARANAAAYGVGRRVHPVLADARALPLDLASHASSRRDLGADRFREVWLQTAPVRDSPEFVPLHRLASGSHHGDGTPRPSGGGATFGLFFDPARRTAAGRRVFTIAAYEPPVAIVRDWLPHVPAAGIKVAPGLDVDELARLGLTCEVEFISVAGELREAALWFGPLHTAARRATLLPSGATLTDTGAPAPPVHAPGKWLLEPDPAVYRARLLGELARDLHAWQIDATIAYLSADTMIETPFARAWAVEETLPFSVKGVRRRLRELRVGSVVVKKRGSPLDPREFERLLRLDSRAPGRRTMFLTRARGAPVAIICANPA